MPGLASLHLDNILFGNLAAANKHYEAFGKNQARERIENADQVTTKDVFSFLQKGQDPETGEAMTLPELVSESGLLIVAGNLSLFAFLSVDLFVKVHFW